MRADRLQTALAGGGTAIGTTIHLSDPAVVEAAAIAGYDWLSLIVEHAPLSLTDVHRQQLAADARGVTTLVHIASPDDGRILPLLNLGVGGIVGSHTESREQAERLVEVTKFPPVGHRGAHASVRAVGYGSVPYDEYLESANDGVLVGVVLEDPAAIADAANILSVPGLSIVFVGLLDLAQSLGPPSDWRTEQVLDSVRAVARICSTLGLTMAMSPYPFGVDELYALGARMVVWPSTDYAMLLDAFHGHIAHARELLSAAADPMAER
jgi:4-hydroxy-2-oxoheptanedioate aldolase